MKTTLAGVGSFLLWVAAGLTWYVSNSPEIAAAVGVAAAAIQSIGLMLARDAGTDKP